MRQLGQRVKQAKENAVRTPIETGFTPTDAMDTSEVPAAHVTSGAPSWHEHESVWAVPQTAAHNAVRFGQPGVPVVDPVVVIAVVAVVPVVPVVVVVVVVPVQAYLT